MSRTSARDDSRSPMKPQVPNPVTRSRRTVSHCNEIVTNAPGRVFAFPPTCHLEGAIDRSVGGSHGRGSAGTASVSQKRASSPPRSAPARRPSTVAPSGSLVPDGGSLAKRTRPRRWVGRIWRRVLDLAAQHETAGRRNRRWKPAMRGKPRAPESSSASGSRHSAPPHDANALDQPQTRRPPNPCFPLRPAAGLG